MRSYVRPLIAVLLCYGAGFLGSLFVSPADMAWYDHLIKPAFQPPSWIFAPVWFVLYGLMSIALVLVWKKDPHAKEGTGWVPFFIAHLLINAAWTMFFFGYHATLIAFIDIVLLWWCVLLLFCGAISIDRRASLLLAPYLAWITFATILSAAIWYLN